MVLQDEGKEQEEEEERLQTTAEPGTVSLTQTVHFNPFIHRVVSQYRSEAPLVNGALNPADEI